MQIIPFAKQKQDFLSKTDKSKKGSIDQKIKPIITTINALPAYYTTSSCAGRIVLLHQISGKKKESQWLFSSHSSIKATHLQNALAEKTLPQKGMVWLLCEAPIIHIACASLEDAWKLIALIKHAGLKRASIISSTPLKITIEAFGNQRIEMPLAQDGHLLIPITSIDVLVNLCNSKLNHSHEQLKKLQAALKKF